MEAIVAALMMAVVLFGSNFGEHPAALFGD
jgi:hypothetical protein